MNESVGDGAVLEVLGVVSVRIAMLNLVMSAIRQIAIDIVIIVNLMMLRVHTLNFLALVVLCLFEQNTIQNLNFPIVVRNVWVVNGFGIPVMIFFEIAHLNPMIF